jgi:hypothetical protein
VVSPILYNIYLHELNIFINEGMTLNKFRSGKAATANPKFKVLLSVTKEEELEADSVRKK